jgi:BASS family bile acid:Na+ symporter
MIIVAAGRENLLTIGPALMLVVLIHNLCGYTLGYWTGRLFKMKNGLQNTGN